jgi:hypothetical protein
MRQKHLVIGLGNLGMDLEIALKEVGHDVTTFTCPDITNGTTIDNLMYLLQSNTFVKIWYCIGGGSVEAADKNYEQMNRIHVDVPVIIMSSMGSQAKLALFSSDYVFGPNTNYAQIKRSMEQTFINHKQVEIYRVTCLYGFHQPEKSLFYKILKNHFANGGTRSAASNVVAPTNTLWLARKLVPNSFRPRSIVNMWPLSAGFPVAAIASIILGLDEINATLDTKRPEGVVLGDLPFEPNYAVNVMSDMLKMWGIFAEEAIPCSDL